LFALDARERVRCDISVVLYYFFYAVSAIINYLKLLDVNDWW